MLVLRGFGDTGAYVSKRWLGIVNSRVRTLRVDHRGTGRSDDPEQPFFVEDMAADAVSVLDAAEVDRAFVCGHSMGGMVAQALALTFPDRVRGLILEATAPSATDPARRSSQPSHPENESASTDLFRPDGSSGPAVPASAAAIRSFFSAFSLVAPGFFDRPAGDVALLEMIHIRQLVPGPTSRVMAHQYAAVSAFDSWEYLADIHVPTLVLHPEFDVKPLRHAQEFAHRIPDSRLVVLPGAGHMIHWETPDDAAGAVLDFVLSYG